MNSPLSEQRPKGRADVVCRQLDDEWVLFDPRATKLHALNLSAAFIWIHSDGDSTPSDIAEALASSFEPPVSASSAREDVDATLQRFREAGLLEGT
jgi:PqqD family protein of HPr-rel-A system